MSETAHETFGFNCADKLLAASLIKKEDRSRVATMLAREYDAHEKAKDDGPDYDAEALRNAYHG